MCIFLIPFKSKDALRCDLHNSAPIQMIGRRENRKILSKFAKRAAQYNVFGCNGITDVQCDLLN